MHGSTTKGDVVKRSDYFTDMGSAVLLCPVLTIVIVSYYVLGFDGRGNYEYKKMEDCEEEFGS